MEGFKEFAEKLKEFENERIQKMKFCQEHNFEHEAIWIQKQISIINQIRMEAELISEGRREPSEIIFLDL